MDYLVWCVICAIIVLTLSIFLIYLIGNYGYGMYKMSIVCYKYDRFLIIIIRSFGIYRSYTIPKVVLVGEGGHVKCRLVKVELNNVLSSNFTIQIHPGDVVRMYYVGESCSDVYRVFVDIGDMKYVVNCMSLS